MFVSLRYDLIMCRVMCAVSALVCDCVVFIACCVVAVVVYLVVMLLRFVCGWFCAFDRSCYDCGLFDGYFLV